MLVVFSSHAHENITMFGDVALRLIKMMGHSGEIPGAILAPDLSDALARLKMNLLNNTTVTTPLHDDVETVSIAQRAFPLIELLQDSIAKDCNVMWKKV